MAIATDEPDRRIAAGRELFATGERESRLVVTSAVPRGGGRWIVHFDGFNSREAAATLRGRWLEADVPADEVPDDPDEFYDRHLIGLAVLQAGDAAPIGVVTAVDHLPGHDLLEVETPRDGTLLVPFVAAVVQAIDRAAGHIMVELPAGLAAATAPGHPNPPGQAGGDGQ